MRTVSPRSKTTVSAPLSLRMRGTTFRTAGVIFHAVRPNGKEDPVPVFPRPSLASAVNTMTPVDSFHVGKNAARQKWYTFCQVRIFVSPKSVPVMFPQGEGTFVPFTNYPVEAYRT